MESESSNIIKKQIFFTFAGLALLGGIAYGSYFAYSTYQNLLLSKNELQTIRQTTAEQVTLLQEQIIQLTSENESINTFLTDEQKKNIDLEKERKSNKKKISTLTKLTTIDPELLKKYSKIFFLSENYIPPELESVEKKYKITPDKNLQVLEDVAPYLEDMLDDADRDDINLKVISAFRSFEEQQKLKSNYTVTYGTGANSFSADQGYSEHQLGTTLDFGTPEVTGAYLSFENTTAFTWLQKNAYKYGFIMSYPKSNSYYQYEPWHWRFVGEDLARDLREDSKSFYELDQRDIDKYLIKIFD